MSARRVLIIAGPNGAGKTTFARAFLPAEARCSRFINADLIAAGLSPFEPKAAAVRAARVMLEETDGCIARGESFAFETTLAGRAYLRRIAAWRPPAGTSRCSSWRCRMLRPRWLVSRAAYGKADTTSLASVPQCRRGTAAARLGGTTMKLQPPPPRPIPIWSTRWPRYAAPGGLLAKLR